MLVEHRLRNESPPKERLEIAKKTFSRTLDNFVNAYRVDYPLHAHSDLMIFYMLRLIVAKQEQEKVEKLSQLRSEERIYSEIFVGAKRGNRKLLAEHFNLIAHDIHGDSDLGDRWTDGRRYYCEEISDAFRKASSQIKQYCEPFIPPPSPWEVKNLF